jgi:tetratricopeptide (TPR) repeat protein
MKKILLTGFLSLLFISLIGQDLSKMIPEKLFLSQNRLILKDYPQDILSQGIEKLVITVYLKGDPISCNGHALSLHGKKGNYYVLLDSLPVNIIYNPKNNPMARYLNGEIWVISEMPMNESEAIAKFSFDGKKLLFIENDIFDPNTDLLAEIEDALKNGDIRLAGELALGVQSPPFGYLESFQLTLLLRAHEVAMEYSKKKDFKKAAEIIGHAYDFFNGITKDSDIKPDSKEARAIADYTYFLHNIKDYKKCIEVSNTCIELSPELAGPYLHLGNSLFETNQKKEATKAYEKFVELRKARKEESRIPAYVFERLGSVKPLQDSPETVVYKFFKWYFDNKINEMELTNWNAPNVKAYRVNFTATENYLKKIQSAGFVSQVYIDYWRSYFKKCDERFIREKQDDGPPMGFEFDFVTNSQENPEKVLPPDFKLLGINGNKARVKYAGYLVYLLQQEEGGWKISGIEK